MPIVYTFFELKRHITGNLVDGQPFEKQLIVWSNLWKKAGFKPIVLTMEDAKKHPDYEKYSKAIATSGNLYEGGYEHMCFMRWLAMAAHGNGGWMADIDLFPMGITPGEGFSLPNDGRFTSSDLHVPSLLSGSPEEWRRMSTAILDYGIERIKTTQDYTDMFAMMHMYEEYPNTYIQENRVWRGLPYKSKGVMDCQAIRNNIAVHLSHRSVDIGIQRGLIDYDGDEKDIHKFIEGNRAILAPRVDMAWREQCGIDMEFA